MPPPSTLARRLWSARRGNHGQVLLIIVVVMIILLVMALFVFDLQQMVHLRVKTQSGVDAAALAAAGWQGRTLNMIGELNLLKASELLTTGLPDESGTRDQRELQGMDILTQMQARLTYVGPLLGFASAQQAAKANQMRASGSYTAALSDHIADVRDLYPAIFTAEMGNYGYNWMAPYQDLLQQISDNGVAAKPTNSSYILQPPTFSGALASLVANEGFYRAVHARLYCWFDNQGFAPDGAYSFADIQMHRIGNYALGSEYLPLYVNIPKQITMQNQVTYRNTAQYTDQELQDRNLPRLQANLQNQYPSQWATFGNTWYDTSMYDTFEQYDYWRSTFKDEYKGAGAAARMICTSTPPLITGAWGWKYGTAPTDASSKSLGQALSFSNRNMGGPQGSFTAQGQKLQSAENRLSDLRSNESVNTVAAAKPFGKIGSDQRVTSAAGLVLPVFTDVRLIPVSLVNDTAYDSHYDFYKFLVEYFGDPNYPAVSDALRAKYAYYTSALDDFSNPDSGFRQGWTAYEVQRDTIIAGPDAIKNTADDGCDPCNPCDSLHCPPCWTGGSGGGGGGGTSRGGPPIVH